MFNNELTFNELSVADFIPNDFNTIDVSSYANYIDDPEVCYKLKVWFLQTKFRTLVADYDNHLSYGIASKVQLENLLVFKKGLEVLNKYNSKDIVGDTTDYNVMKYSTIIDVLYTLNNKY